MPVWLITGCSTGSGRELAREVLARGRHVAVTARDPGAISDIAAVQAEAPPFRLVRGRLAVQRIRAELEAQLVKSMPGRKRQLGRIIPRHDWQHHEP